MGQVIDFFTGKAVSEVRDVRSASTEELMQAWDAWDGDPATMFYPFDMEDVHAELNRRGEGSYCAV